MAIRTTSSGSCTMVSPLSENITTMVKSSATSVIGLIRGMKTLLVPLLALQLAQRRSGVTKPAMNGMPR